MPCQSNSLSTACRHVPVHRDAAVVLIRFEQPEAECLIHLTEYRQPFAERRRIDEQIVFVDQVVLDQARDEAGTAINDDVLAVLCLDRVDLVDDVALG